MSIGTRTFVTPPPLEVSRVTPRSRDSGPAAAMRQNAAEMLLETQLMTVEKLPRPLSATLTYLFIRISKI